MADQKERVFEYLFFNNIVRKKNTFLGEIVSLTFAKKYFDQKIVNKNI